MAETFGQHLQDLGAGPREQSYPCHKTCYVQRIKTDLGSVLTITPAHSKTPPCVGVAVGTSLYSIPSECHKYVSCPSIIILAYDGVQGLACQGQDKAAKVLWEFKAVEYFKTCK